MAQQLHVRADRPAHGVNDRNGSRHEGGEDRRHARAQDPETLDGDSIGRWEGDTLVVETTNFNPQHGFRGAWENLRVTERFAYVDANTIRYRFTIDDHYVDAVLHR